MSGIEAILFRTYYGATEDLKVTSLKSRMRSAAVSFLMLSRTVSIVLVIAHNLSMGSN